MEWVDLGVENEIPIFGHTVRPLEGELAGYAGILEQEDIHMRHMPEALAAHKTKPEVLKP